MTSHGTRQGVLVFIYGHHHSMYAIHAYIGVVWLVMEAYVAYMECLGMAKLVLLLLHTTSLVFGTCSSLPSTYYIYYGVLHISHPTRTDNNSESIMC